MRERRRCSRTSMRAAAARRSTNWAVRHTRPLPRALPVAEIRRVMVRMGPRDRLIVEWALLTGARRMEIADLKFAQLPGIDSVRSEDRPEIPIRLETAKQSRATSIRRSH